jgi:predicted nucleotidyltransferase
MTIAGAIHEFSLPPEGGFPVDKEISRIINEYQQKLEISGIKVKKIILYGSHAWGKPDKDSDIDLIVVSDDFRDMDLWERLSLLGRARMGIKRPMEILGFTEKEFAETPIGSFIGDEVKPKGVVVP